MTLCMSTDTLKDLLYQGVMPEDLRQLALQILESVDPPRTLTLNEQATSKVKFIYARRARKAAQVMGLQQFLDNLMAYELASVLATYLRDGDRIVYFWLSDDGTSLLGCIVGTIGDDDSANVPLREKDVTKGDTKADEDLRE